MRDYNRPQPRTARSQPSARFQAVRECGRFADGVVKSGCGGEISKRPPPPDVPLDDNYLGCRIRAVRPSPFIRGPHNTATGSCLPSAPRAQIRRQ